MTLVWRVLILLVVVVAVAALLLSLAGGIGVWMVKGRVTDFATSKFDKAEAALDKADRGLTLVNATLANAAERLEAARQDQRSTPRNNNLARRLLARTVQQTIAPQLDEAQATLNTIAEALVVVKSVLEDAAELPTENVGLDADRLTRLRGQLSQVGPAAWE